MGQPACRALAAPVPEAGLGAGGAGGRDLRTPADSDDDSGDLGRLTTRRERQYFSTDGTDSICLSGALRECQQYRAGARRRSRALHDLAVDADLGWRDASEADADEEEDLAWGDLDVAIGSLGLGEDEVN